MARSSGSSGGIGFFGLLTIVFVTLKLTGFIDWHWLWVASPILGAAGLLVAFIVFCLVMAVFTKQI